MKGVRLERDMNAFAGVLAWLSSAWMQHRLHGFLNAMLIFTILAICTECPIITHVVVTVDRLLLVH